jgi:hypothetical protein
MYYNYNFIIIVSRKQVHPPFWAMSTAEKVGGIYLQEDTVLYNCMTACNTNFPIYSILMYSLVQLGRMPLG